MQRIGGTSLVVKNLQQPDLPTIPVAQYLRMSTEDQQYSIANQRLRILEYAQAHGFSITRTYEDPGKSGVIIKHRKGLSALLKDVVGGDAEFRAILVYDVSRWGRFQNPDEAAHYEFLCTNSGIPLHYCAEQFSNDGTATSCIVKALKRSMAAEFSRELGDKVIRGKNRLAEMGFWMGGPSGYGYRRRMVSADGKLKQILKTGEQKSLKTDRITLVLGPRKEVEGVRVIYSMAAKGANCTDIVRALDRNGVLIHGKQWNDVTVLHILNNPKYMGTNVWNRCTQRLQTRVRTVEPQFWKGKPRAFPAIVDQQTFDRAQATLKRMRDSRWSVEKVVPMVRALLKSKGRLTERLIKKTRGMPSSGTIHKFFGTYKHLYEMVDYQPEHVQVYKFEQSRRSAILRRSLGDNLKTLFPDHVKILLSRRGARSIVRVDDRFTVSILFCRQERPVPPKRRAELPGRPGRPPLLGACWGAEPVPAECEYITLICLLTKRFDRIRSFYVVDRLGDRLYIRLRRNGEFLRQAIKLDGIQDFYAAVTRIWENRKAEACPPV